MKNWKSFLLLALVFFSGLALGVVGTRIVVRHAVQQAMVHPEKVQMALERSLQRRLRLEVEQQAQLHVILTDTRSQLNELRKQFQPQAAVVLRQTDKKIGALLTPEQQARYEKLEERGWPALRRLQATP